MRTDRLEAWVLQIVDQVQEGHLIEDSRVELKGDWPDPKSAGRRIAGHANAAGSDSILWVIGLDEKKGAVSVTPTDSADWLPKVEAEFEGVSPKVVDLVVPTGTSPVIALLFDVSRRPFVVKNQVFGKTGGGAVSLEVPWRRGTKIHSARRDELLRILVPRQALPFVELLEASASLGIHKPVDPAGYGRRPSPKQLSEHLAWSFDLKLYVTPHNRDLLVLPTHKASLKFRVGSEETVSVDEFRFFPPYRSTGTGLDYVVDSSTVTASVGEAVLKGPGLLTARADYYEAVRELPINANVSATLAVAPAESDMTTETAFQLEPSERISENELQRWKTEEQESG